jgi:hypothetical protein
MTQVIVYTNNNGGVSVCYPTGELTIEAVLAKDCPKEAIIVNESELPKDDFDAWELIDGKIVVNQAKKQAIIEAKQEAEYAKTTAINKLKALGLTDAEIQALKGTA